MRRVTATRPAAWPDALRCYVCGASNTSTWNGVSACRAHRVIPPGESDAGDAG